MKTLRTIITQLLAMVLALVIFAWIPVSIFFVIKGIWGDSRWFFTGLSMLVTAFVTAVAVLLYHMQNDRTVKKQADQPLDWK